MIKALRTILIESLLVILLAPQAFVLLYYFTYFFKGGNPWGLFQALSVYALTVSWVSAPVLAAAVLLVRLLLTKQVRWYAMFAFCVGVGYLWLAAWNVLVYDIFSYLRSALPVLLCSLGMAGYTWARNFYQRNLPAVKTENDAADLSE